jgi:excisionase family DNA binding protein
MSDPASEQPADRLAYSIDEATGLTGLSRDLLYDQMRAGNLAYLKVGRRRIITRQHLEAFLTRGPPDPAHRPRAACPQATSTGSAWSPVLAGCRCQTMCSNYRTLTALTKFLGANLGANSARHQATLRDVRPEFRR